MTDWFSEYQRQLHGYQFPQQPEPEYTDPSYYDPAAELRRLAAEQGVQIVNPREAELDARIAELQQFQQEYDSAREQEQQAAAQAITDQQAAAYAAELDAWFDEVGLTEVERELVVSRAATMEPTSDGLLDIDGALEALGAAVVQREEAEASEHPPLDATHAERTEWAANKLRESERAQRDVHREEGNDDRPWVREEREPDLENADERIRYETELLTGEAA